MKQRDKSQIQLQNQKYTIRYDPEITIPANSVSFKFVFNAAQASSLSIANSCSTEISRKRAGTDLSQDWFNGSSFATQAGC